MKFLLKSSLLISSLFLFIYSCSKDSPLPAPTATITYTLTAIASEGGTVNNTGGTYNENSNVSITATADAGYEFTSWSGDASGTDNPLTGQNFRGWCGDPQPWTKSLVDLADYAGQAVQFRFRLGTDGSVGRPEGWKIDDIKVKSCQRPNLIFANGFELID